MSWKKSLNFIAQTNGVLIHGQKKVPDRNGQENWDFFFPISIAMLWLLPAGILQGDGEGAPHQELFQASN